MDPWALLGGLVTSLLATVLFELSRRLFAYNRRHLLRKALMHVRNHVLSWVKSAILKAKRPLGVLMYSYYGGKDMASQCCLYESGDAITWTRRGSPFDESVVDAVARKEEARLKRFQEATREPSGRYRSYVYQILRFEDGKEIPNTFVENLRRHFGVVW